MSFQPKAPPAPPTMLEAYLKILLAIEATGMPLFPEEHATLTEGLRVLAADPEARRPIRLPPANDPT